MKCEKDGPPSSPVASDDEGKRSRIKEVLSESHLKDCLYSSCDEDALTNLYLLAKVCDEKGQKYTEEMKKEASQAAVEPTPSTSGVAPRTRSKKMHCDQCGKTFAHRGDFNKHKRKHTGEQPYSCNICTKKFAHTSNLTRHKQVHSGDKPFKCDNCNRLFGRKDKLISHKKTRLCDKYGRERQRSDSSAATESELFSMGGKPMK